MPLQPPSRTGTSRVMPKSQPLVRIAPTLNSVLRNPAMPPRSLRWMSRQKTLHAVAVAAVEHGLGIESGDGVVDLVFVAGQFEAQVADPAEVLRPTGPPRHGYKADAFGRLRLKQFIAAGKDAYLGSPAACSCRRPGHRPRHSCR